MELQQECEPVSPEYEGKQQLEEQALLLASSLFASAKSFLHLLLHVLHLLSPLLAQALLVVSDDGSVAHEGDEPDAEQVGEARAQPLHGGAVALGVLQVDLQDGPAEELGFTHHAVVERVQVLVAQIVAVALLKVFLPALTVLRTRLHHLHELSELVLQVLLHLRVLAIQGLLLDLHQRVAILLGQLVQRSVDGAELAFQGADVLVVHVVQHHPDQGTGHAENWVDHGCC